MLEVGQVVKVRPKIKGGNHYGGIFFAEEMEKYRSKEYKITEVISGGKQCHLNLEDGDGELWTFSEEMFVKDYKKETIEDGDIIENTTDNRTKGYAGIFHKNKSRPEGFIEFIEKPKDWEGHEGDGTGTAGYCWYYPLHEYKKIKTQKVEVINSVQQEERDKSWFESNKILSLYDKISHDTVIENNVYEVIYNIADIFIIRSLDRKKYHIIWRSGLKFLEEETSIPETTTPETSKTSEDNSKVFKELKNSIERLSNKIEERSPFQQAMTEAIIEKGKELAVEDLKEKLKIELNEFIEKTYGVLPKKIILKREEKEKELTGLFHKDFEKICKIVESNTPLMLVGGAGAGKNHTLEQVAEALDLTFYTTNAVNQDYKLTGFIDANGKYHETEFYKAFTNGGMFFLDEIDASCPEALIILNGAIANKYFDFPTGRVMAHKDFRVVCAGNTYGTGADMVYVGRNVLDGATLDRFVVLPFDYDEEVEKKLAYDMELYNFIRDLRKAVNDSGLRYIVSMRALINSSKLLEIGIDKKNILKTAIIKNMQKDDINTIINKISRDSEWKTLLKQMSDIND